MENRKIKILAIDDIPDNLISLKAQIKDAFPEAVVFTALDGTKGIEISAAEDPDVILLDILMPGMDGFEVCRRLKTDHKLYDIPIVFLTAIKGDKESRIRALECGAEALLAKPIDETELIAQIRAMVKIKTANIVKRNEKERLTQLVDEKVHELKITHTATLNLLEDLKNENELRKLSEAKLQAREEHFRAITQTANDAIITINNDGIVTGWNKGAEKIFGYSEEEITGKDLTLIMPQHYREQHNDGIKRVVNNGDHHVIGKTAELVGLHKNSTEFPLELSLSTWETASGKYFAGIIRDISERKMAEKELVEAKDHAEQSDRLKSAFLANMSHEIRTPMNGILGFAELLKEPDLTGEQQQDYIRIIERSGERMLNIINDIVDISKIESQQMKVSVSATNVNEKIEYLHTFFKPETDKKGIEFRFKNGLPERKANILTDREKIYAILTNLVKNAIKFCDKGTIEIGYDLVETPTLAETQRVASLPDPETSLQFYVRDTGIGIPKDRQEAIFDRFIQVDLIDKMARQGAGLGLSISKAYVEMLGGKIWVESEEGVGSTFYFTLPYIAVPIEEPLDISFISVKEAITLIRKLKILIVEDDEISEKLLEREVRRFSKRVFKAKTGFEAVDVCQNNPDIDLVLMDIKMPGMDGYEATRQIRQFNKEVVIIAQTAFALTGDREMAMKVGCNDYIPKPIRRDKLAEVMKKYF